MSASTSISNRTLLTTLTAVSLAGVVAVGVYYLAEYYVRRRQLTSLPSLSRYRPLRNRYYAVRHGQSTANTAGIISSDPVVALYNHGLTDVGQVEAATAARILSQLITDATSIVVISSDFCRAKQTADIIHSRMRLRRPLVLKTALRERNFGQLNGLDNGEYHKVWERDAVNPFHNEWAVESAADVYRRGVALIAECESSYTASVIILVSHGDTLQILQTAFQLVSPSKHRSLQHLGNGHVRQLSINDKST